jgi:hypothetical protein
LLNPAALLQFDWWCSYNFQPDRVIDNRGKSIGHNMVSVEITSMLGIDFARFFWISGKGIFQRARQLKRNNTCNLPEIDSDLDKFKPTAFFTDNCPIYIQGTSKHLLINYQFSAWCKPWVGNLRAIDLQFSILN